MNISKTWDINPLDFAKDVHNDIVDLTLDVSKQIFNGVVSRTPVYTGSLRASWTIGTSENYGVIVGGSPTNPLSAPTFPENLKLNKLDVVYIMNSTPYAVLVEFGGPKNIPRAMVQQTLSVL